MIRAFAGAAIFDGRRLHEGAVLVVEQGGASVMGKVPEGIMVTTVQGGTILPGFVDLQVNGGGGVMLNDAPDIDTLRIMAQAHRGLGTAAFLPTLITDTPANTRAAIDAVAAAIAAGVPGIAGLHLEGPHLSRARKGAHDGALIRAMTDADLTVLLDAARRLPALMVTLAPENATPAQIGALAQAGVIVSLGHSDCGYDTARDAINAGARCVTHLFNAMSPLTSREPGLVGAALDHAGVAVGLIADGIHVHPATIRAALAAKHGPEEVFLVTDAMATAGSEIDSFTLNGRTISRADGRLTLADGTLAGADLTMAGAVRTLTDEVGETSERALARATSIPAAVIGAPGGMGGLQQPLDRLIYLGPDNAPPVWCDTL